MSCYVLEIQDSKAIMICYLTLSVLSWDLGNGVAVAGPGMGLSWLLQSSGMVQVRMAVPPALNPFLHICGKKETPTWNKFPGKNSVQVPRVMSWVFSSSLAVSA